MSLRRNWAPRKAHNPLRTGDRAEACEGCDKTEQTQDTLFSNSTDNEPCRVYPVWFRPVMIRHMVQNINDF